MATQGVVSIVKDGKVLVKIVAGCDGYNADNLAKAILTKRPLSLEEIQELARSVSFGCEDCLVVMDAERHLFVGDLAPLYREKFNDPRFNPRWEIGTAPHVVLVDECSVSRFYGRTPHGTTE